MTKQRGNATNGTFAIGSSTPANFMSNSNTRAYKGGGMQELGVRIRSGISSEDLPRLMSFYATRFRPNHPLINGLLFDWCFKQSSEVGTRAASPQQWTVLTAWDGGDIVGHIGIVPVTLRAHGMLLKAAWFINIFVVPEYTGLGIGTALITRGSCDYDVVMGLGTTEEGLNLYRRNQYVLLGHLHRHLRVLRADHASTLLAKQSEAAEWLLRDAEQRSVKPLVAGIHLDGPMPFDDVPCGYCQLWHRFSQQFVASVERSPEYLRWRYAHNPDLRYNCLVARRSGEQLAGMLVYRVDYPDAELFAPVVRILDLIADADVSSTLLAGLESYARSIDAAVIEYFCATDMAASSFADCGYIRDPHPLSFDVCRWYHPPRLTSPIPVPLSYRPTGRDPDVDIAPLRSLANWHVTLGDSDLDRIQR